MFNSDLDEHQKLFNTVWFLCILVVGLGLGNMSLVSDIKELKVENVDLIYLNKEIKNRTIELEANKNQLIIDKNEELISRLEISELIEEQVHLVIEVDTVRSFERSNCDALSDIVVDIEVFERIVEAEATGGTIEQKMNVAQTVLNRVESDKFPNTVKSVVFQRNDGRWQFSPLYDGRYYTVSIKESTKKAVQNVLNSTSLHDGLYFVARSSADTDNVSWFDRNLEFLFDDGIHEHFKEIED